MSSRPAVGLLAAALVLSSGGCARDLDPLSPASFPRDPAIFLDGFGDGVGFAAFGGSKTDAVQIDQSVRYRGDAALQVTVPNVGDPSGAYAGGAFVGNVPRNLSDYNALTFWARSSRPATLDVAGLGNDNTGTSRFTAEATGLALTGSWTKYVVPIPDPARLDQEAGLFYFAEGPENGQGTLLWFDEIRYENASGVSAPRPSITGQTLRAEVGATAQVTGTRATFTVDGREVTVSASPSYFAYTSSDESVAVVDEQGLITVVGTGSATITATLQGVQAEGSVVVRTALPPQTPAPTPTRDPADVISLFSNAYTDVPVDTWSAVWDNANVEDIQIGGDDTKKYSDLVFAGIEFTSAPVDAGAMTHFHMDFYTPDATGEPAAFRIKLVDFGADGAFGGGDDSEHEITLTAATDPALATDGWVSMDIPLSRFPGLTGRGALAQLILSGDPNTVYIDNVYFWGPGTPSAPEQPAPTPTYPASGVISLFSDAYTDVAVDTWSAPWDVADTEDLSIGGNATKKYSNLQFAGIEMVSAPVDASGMTHFRMDFWTPDPTADPAAFRVKLVDFGADGAFQGGDDTEHEVVLTAASTPAIGTGAWMSLDIPLADFTNLTSRGAVAQLIISGDPNTVFLDNILFYDAGAQAPTEPATAAPTPTLPAGNVISLFSDAYTDVTVDTWSAVWDAADLEDVTVDGNATKKYTNHVFAGIEATSAPIDASGMTHVHLDLWTPDETDAPAVFRLKIVDFGADAAFGGGDDVEHELTFTAATTPGLVTGSWISLDVPLSDFTGLTTRGAIAQMITSGDLGTFFIDNVYFHN